VLFLLNKTLVNCYAATITFPIHVLSHRSANRTCWDATVLPLSLTMTTVTFIVTTLKTSNLTQSSELFSKQNVQQLSAQFVKLKIWQLSIYRISRKQYCATS
jgi:hypothetical protein